LFSLKNGLFTTGQWSSLGVQATGLIAIAVFSFVCAYILFKLLDKIIGIRVHRNVEQAGIDSAEYGVEAYTTFD